MFCFFPRRCGGPTLIALAASSLGAVTASCGGARGTSRDMSGDADVDMTAGSTDDMANESDGGSTMSSDLMTRLPTLSFAAGVSYGATTQNKKSILIGDVTSDGKADLVILVSSPVVMSFAGGLVTLPGRGDGTFGPEGDTTLGSGPIGVLADFNSDGKADLMVDYVIGKYDPVSHRILPFEQVSDVVFASDGTGTANDPTGLNAHVTMAAAPFDANTSPDIVSLNQQSTAFVMNLNNGTGTFTATTATVGAHPIPTTALVTRDFTGDNHPDVAYALDSTLVTVPVDSAGTA